MATRINQPSSNPYAGGAVIFDSSPYANLYIQQVQREAAKDEALDKYFQEWGKSINPAGMRNQDTQDLLNLVNQSRDFYFQNKKAIKNPALDGGRAYSEYMSKQKEAMGLVNSSKQIAQKEDLINRNILAARQKGLPITDRVVMDLDAFRQPLRSQNWRDFNPDNLDFQPKPFDFARFTKDIYGDTKLSEKIAGEKKVPESFEKITTFETFLDDNELPKVESRAVAAYRSSPSVKEFIDGLSQNQAEVSKLNTLYRNKYGKNISTPEDVAVSFALSLSPAGKTREVRTKDVAAELAAREQNIRTRPSKARGSSGGGSGSIGNIRDVYNEIEGLVDSRGVTTAGVKMNAPLNLLSANAQKIILSSIKPIVGEKSTQEDFVLNRDNATGRLAIYNVEDGGVKGSRVAFLDELDINLPAQVSVKERREVIEKSKQPTKPKSKDPLGLF